MVDVVGAAERESECEAGLQNGVEAAPRLAAQHQASTDRGAHGDGIVQGAAYGHKAVIGHHGQEESLSGDQQGEEEELGSTSLKGNDLFIPSTSAPVSPLSCQSLDFKEA